MSHFRFRLRINETSAAFTHFRPSLVPPRLLSCPQDFPAFNPALDEPRLSELELLLALLDNCFGDISTPDTPESRRGRFRKELQTIGSALYGLLLRSNSRQLRRLEKLTSQGMQGGGGGISAGGRRGGGGDPENGEVDFPPVSSPVPPKSFWIRTRYYFFFALVMISFSISCAADGC